MIAFLLAFYATGLVATVWTLRRTNGAWLPSFLRPSPATEDMNALEAGWDMAAKYLLCGCYTTSILLFWWAWLPFYWLGKQRLRREPVPTDASQNARERSA